MIRSAWVDIELVLEIMYDDQSIKDPEVPIPANIKNGKIEFKNVNFAYDKHLAVDERR
jgi:ABC-type multidrug transport system fused ATPase/permease subunit